MTLERDPDDELDHTIDDNERGLKDTVRVNPNEIVEIAVRFTTYAGRYMYHCHILEHEDRDMMRPFVTMPPELMPFMACRSSTADAAHLVHDLRVDGEQRLGLDVAGGERARSRLSVSRKCLTPACSLAPPGTHAHPI